MHLHLIEPRPDGHRMQYVRRLVETAPKDWSISLSTFSGSVKHPATQEALAAGGERITLVTIDGQTDFERHVRGSDGFRLQPAYWRLMRRHWLALRPAQRGNLAVMPYLDYCSYAIGLMGSPFGDTPFSGIVMRPDFHWPEQGVVSPAPRQARLKQWLFMRLLANRRLKCLLTIDPSLRDWVVKHQPRGHERLRYADDPSDLQGFGDRVAARRHFGLRNDSVVVLLFGSIDLRKGVARLLDLAASRTFPSEGQVLIVGQQSDEVRALLRQRVRRLPVDWVVSVDRYVDRQDEWLAFASADFVWAAYEGFYGPSGVVAQCRQASLSVIHRGSGLIGYQFGGSALIPNAWLGPHRLLVGRHLAGEAKVRGLAQVLTP